MHWPAIYSCYYCQKVCCAEHRLAESHECPKVIAARHIEKDWLRRKGTNITSARFGAICKQCGFTSDYSDIEEGNRLRIEHIKTAGCRSGQVQLRQHQEDRAVDNTLRNRDLLQTEVSSEIESGVPDWMYDSLNTAKNILKQYHTFCGCDIEGFVKISDFKLFIQHDKPNAYGYISLTGNPFKIGVHPIFQQYDKRDLVPTMIHELLHALHPEWQHDKVNPEEKLLANKAGYFDALVELQRMAVSGKMRFCLQ